uniref:p15 n=1 Tax=Haemonchus contortus TaxID=6289 RepID=F6MHJ5_HAECO|nr:p15 [Haemonchus contortus]
MFFAFAVLLIALATREAYGESQLNTEFILGSGNQVMFENINKEYNTHLKWDDDLAAKAMVEAVRPHYRLLWNTGDYFTIRNDKLFTKRYVGPLEEKVRLVLLNPFKKYADKLRQLPEGTTYGCNGFFDTDTMPNDNYLYVAGVYNIPN